MKKLLALPFILLLLPSTVAADMMIGGDISYPTKKGDCLLLVGAKVGVDWQVIARENRIEPNNQCKVRAPLAIDLAIDGIGMGELCKDARLLPRAA
jgi:hypothetical protein